MTRLEAIEPFVIPAADRAADAASLKLRVHRRGDAAREAIAALLPTPHDDASQRVVVRCELGRHLVALVGLRAGADCRFVAEREFRHSAERELEHALCVPVQRRHVVELDALRLWRPHHAGHVFTGLVAFLHGAGFQWAMTSASARLYRRLERLDFEPVELARTRDGATAIVCCGSVTAAYRRLAKRMARDAAAEHWNANVAVGRRFRIDRAMHLLETVGS
ncbi:MAG: thermostable hemolysin [Gammaproteobacteria bacterium]|nr:thermostable hemolysin [Gammaproteobacteria bacterium]MBI5619200.1 thermostable hemolysin [Gammaproteobacteria bacterium]